jgi:hypothetical protein
MFDRGSNKKYGRATRAGIAGLEFAVVSLHEHEIVTYLTCRCL